MGPKLTRAAILIDRYGWRNGLKIYLQLKQKRVDHLKLPGIDFPFALRKSGTDTAVFEQIFLRGDYDMDVPFEPRLIIDAGANIGLFSVLMKSKFPQAKIICIEPGEANCGMLEKNLARYSDIEIIRAGLWHSDTRLRVIDKYDAGDSSLVSEEDPGGMVTGISMNTLVNKYAIERIDVLKIDIEGSEQALFLKNFEQWLPRVRMIIIELHDWLMPGSSKPFFDAIQKTFPDYTYAISGENTIILNNRLA